MITTPEQMREAAMSRIDALINAANDAGLDDRKEGLRDAYHAIRAIPIAPQPVAVTVKPLVWVALGAGYMAHDPLFQTTALALSADYCAEYDAERAARILSALTLHPADPLSDPRVVALVEAAALAQYGLSWASAYFRDSNPPYCDDPCPPVNRGLDATRAALRAIGGEA